MAVFVASGCTSVFTRSVSDWIEPRCDPCVKLSFGLRCLAGGCGLGVVGVVGAVAGCDCDSDRDGRGCRGGMGAVEMEDEEVVTQVLVSPVLVCGFLCSPSGGCVVTFLSGCWKRSSGWVLGESVADASAVSVG